MSNVARVAGQAANTLSKPLSVEDVFSTYLYTGTSAAKTITNNIDLSTDGGLVWFKVRTTTGNHALFDTERGVTKHLASNATDAEGTQAGGLTAFNTDGFTVGSWGEVNENNQDLASWSFRKAPKFFDVVTYTGTGSAQTISHNLGSVPGMIIVKSTSNAFNWVVYHRGTDATAPEDYITYLDLTNARADVAGAWNDTAPTSTEFTVGTTSAVNFNGGTFVAYLFAHNDGDGEFGPDGDADIISCGSYTGSGSAGKEITLGWEPQWLLIKKTSAARDWVLLDNMRGMFSDAAQTGVPHLHPNTTAAESSVYQVYPTATGFVLNTGGSDVNGNDDYIYIAIRRGPMAVPESATDVFDVGDASETGSTAPEYEGGFTVDMAIKRIMSASQPNYIFDRLRGGQSLRTDTTDAESAFGAAKFDYMDGYYNGTSSSSTDWSAMWKRAPSFFDVVAYTGNATQGRNINHNLGVAPEMIWVKRRSAARNWAVYHSALGNEAKMALNLIDAEVTGATTHWQSTTPTDTVFTVGTQFDVNNNGATYIAYLFASLDGVSKVGSYTGSASAQTIDCGFTAGAKFVLIKRTDSTGSWVVWDTSRGIVADNDPYFKLETNAAPTTTDDYIDPHNSGFTLAGGVGFTNTSGGTYIFYAIA